ncbi:MAG: hypothetical protein IJV52_05155 [Prevotella sp.]|nr:hypothetical protein [Prevotella sp.]
MRRIITLCAISLFLCAHPVVTKSATPSIRQDSVKTSVNGNTSETTFYVYATVSQNYYIKFWVMGVKHFDGTFSKYGIRVDNGSVTDTIVTTQADWQMRTPKNSQTMYLTEGYHEISLEGTINDIPNAERVASYSYSPFIYNSSIYRDNAAYAAMKSHTEITSLSGPDYLSTDYRQISYKTTELDPLGPPYHYDADLNKNVFYSFFRLEHFTQGQYFSCNTTAADTLSHVIHLFNLSDNSISFTSAASTNGNASLFCIIPQTGFYYVLVRTTDPNQWGTCQLNINGSRYFENVPICCSRTNISSPFSDRTYSCFATSDVGDPMIMLMAPGSTGGVLNYNDDYHPSSPSGIDWKKNSRIDGALSNNQWIFTLVKSYPTPSFKRCDIYTRCERTNSTLFSFYNYLTDDIMYSSYPTNFYNCISWAVGDWIYGYWIPWDDGNEFVDSIFTAYGYHSGESEEKARIDLWGITDGYGNIEYTHGSVRAKRHQYSGGYAWESKLGSSFRVFHPRYALIGASYGSVIGHYGKNLGVVPVFDSPYLLNISLDQDEFNAIERGVGNISSMTKNDFEDLYTKCLSEGNVKVSIFIDSFEKTESYNSLLEFCKKNPSVTSLLCQKILQQDILSIKLLKDIVLSGNKAHIWKETLSEIREMCRKQADGKCLHNAQTYAMLLIKKLLNANYGNDNLCRNVSFSNSCPMTITNNQGTITLSFDLDSDAYTSVIIGKTDGTLMKSIMNRKKLDKGHQSVQFYLTDKGIYTIGLIVNGTAYKKTFTIE